MARDTGLRVPAFTLAPAVLGLALLILPLLALLGRASWSTLWADATSEQAVAALWLSVRTGVAATALCVVLGVPLALVIARSGPKAAQLLRALIAVLIRDMRIDNTIGMVASELAQWFIIITTGSVLFSHGITTINTAADAAKALEPLVRSFPNSGQVARDLFAIGVIGLGLLAIPVLAGSAAYALAEAFDWREGLSLRLGQAKGFYGVIIASTAVGFVLNFIGVDPMKALVFTAVFNGVAAVPLLFVIARINDSRAILGSLRGGPLSRGLVWLTFAVMALAAAAMLYTLVLSH